MPINSVTVALAALLTAVATGVGAIPLLRPNVSLTEVGLANAMAAGLMLAASAVLFYEGALRSPALVAAGGLAGMAFVVLSRRMLGGRHETLHLGSLRGVDALKALMIVGVMTAHSFAEGVGVGVAYGGGEALGVFITLAIAVHNIPEGLAISLVLVPRGMPVWQAALWCIFSSLPQPLMAVPAFRFVDTFEPVLPLGLGFAAGAMVWMTFRELLPEALERAPRWAVFTMLALAAAFMLWFQIELKG